MDFIKTFVEFLQGLFAALTEFLGNSVPVLSGFSNIKIPGVND